MAMRVADAVWVAAAMLHRAYPDRLDFSVAEIVAKVAAENVAGGGMHGPCIQAHVSVHCVAGKRPQPNRAKMLTETSRGRRRLYRPGDPCHPDRRSGGSLPDRNALPPACRELLDWYRREYLARASHAVRGPEGAAHPLPEAVEPEDLPLEDAAVEWPVPDPLLALAGLGKEIWADENADAYVRRLREGWE